MKKTLIIFLFALGIALPSLAQSQAVQKVAKSVFTLTTYKADGTILATAHGVYCNATGEGIAAFTPFVGAKSATVIDGNGKKYDVTAIIGADEIYDICRFRLSGNVNPLQVSPSTENGKLWVVGYSTKKAKFTPITVKSSEKFLDKYNYYVFNEEINDDIEGCPIVNEAGMAVGLVQRSSTSYSIHSTDASYYSTLASNGLSLSNPTMLKTGIRIALPDDHEQARLLLLMLNGSMDSLNVRNTTEEFINKYPNEIDGYNALAKYEVAHSNLKEASDAMETGIKKTDKKDEAYYEYAKLIYNTVAYIPDSLQTTWTFSLAEDNVSKAIDINPQASYKHLLAQIKYAKKDFNASLALLEELASGDMPTSEVYYEIAQCKSRLGAEKNDIFTYINKAVEVSPQPLTYISAPYILARGMMLDEMGEAKKALQDYNKYDTLMNFRASADFYYTRYKCEAQLKQFQQAINDISHACVINQQEPTYLAELASIELRVGKYEEAVQACDICLQLTQEYSDVYIVKGVALHQLGRNEESKEALLKAKELGDERADSYLQKYSK